MIFDANSIKLTTYLRKASESCAHFTQYVFVEGAGEVDVDQLAVIQSQTQDLTCKPEVV